MSEVVAPVHSGTIDFAAPEFETGRRRCGAQTQKRDRPSSHSNLDCSARCRRDHSGLRSSVLGAGVRVGMMSFPTP